MSYAVLECYEQVGWGFKKFSLNLRVIKSNGMRFPVVLKGFHNLNCRSCSGEFKVWNVILKFLFHSLSLSFTLSFLLCFFLHPFPQPVINKINVKTDMRINKWNKLLTKNIHNSCCINTLLERIEFLSVISLSLHEGGGKKKKLHRAV